MKIRKLLTQEAVCSVVAGMPKAPQGIRCNTLRRFVVLYSQALVKDMKIASIAYLDESFSTVLASEYLRGRGLKCRDGNYVQYKHSLDAVSQVRHAVASFHARSVGSR